MNVMRKLIKMSINRHNVSEDMQKSKANDKAFVKRMLTIENNMAELENRHLQKFTDFQKVAQKIDDRVSESNQIIRTAKGNFKRLIQHNSDQISNIDVHIDKVDKFNNQTKDKIDEIFLKIKQSKGEAQEM